MGGRLGKLTLNLDSDDDVLIIWQIIEGPLGSRVGSGDAKGDRTCTTRDGRAIPALANRPETQRDLSLNRRPPEWGTVEPRHPREIRSVPLRMGWGCLQPRTTAKVLALRCMSWYVAS